MYQTSPLTRFAIIAFSALLGFPAAPVWADETEVREFNVTVDGKPSGYYRMAITRKDDGHLVMKCEADVKVKVLGFTGYSYTYRGVEIWRNHQLISLQSSCTDDGKKFIVRAEREGDQLIVNVNGARKTVRGDVWLTTVWQLPAMAFRNGPLPLLEADNGLELQGQMQRISEGTRTIAGQPRLCTCYRLLSSSPHDIWYDAQERMVRQVWTEDGHKTILELVRIGR